jgi:hypothetical protein
MPRNALRFLDRSMLTALTQPALFTEVNYAVPSPVLDYPSTAQLPVTRSGQLKIVVWQQDLLFDDLLIRSTESLGVIDGPKAVVAGDIAILSTGDRSLRSVPVSVQRSPGSTTAG